MKWLLSLNQGVRGKPFLWFFMTFVLFAVLGFGDTAFAHWSHDLLTVGLTTLTIAVIYPFMAKLYAAKWARRTSPQDDHLLAIINNTAEGIITIDEHGLIETFNPAAEQIFGYARSEVVGKDVSLLLPNAERAMHQHYLDQTALYESRVIDKANDFEGQRKDGSLFPLGLTVARINTAEKRFVGFLRDVTERKQRELELEKATLRAESANIAKSMFLSSMSHEFRTPLNAIIGFGEMLEHGLPHPLKPKQKEYMSHILSSAGHLLHLVGDVLEMSQIEAGIASCEPEAFAVEAAVNDALKYVSIRAKKARITVSINCSGQGRPHTVRADPLRFRQVMINLLSNAIKYNREGGWIKVDCAKTQDGNVRISVSDNGYGIPPDKQHGVFEPFNRMGREAGAIEGTGIGLTITKDLVEIMGGSIDFDSTDNVGSTFSIELPVA